MPIARIAQEMSSVMTWLVRLPYGWTLVRFYPELARMPDPDDRWRVLQIVLMNLPSWQRRLWNVAYFVVTCIGAMLPLFVAFHVGGLPGPSSNSVTAVLFWFFILPGASTTFAVISLFWLHSRFVHKRCRSFLLNIGHAMCPSCGFNLAGHVDDTVVTCPECGESVDLRMPGRFTTEGAEGELNATTEAPRCSG